MLFDFATSLLDVNHLIQAGGLLVIVAIIFAETGLLIGFFLPGDTLLIAAGIFASRGDLQLIPLLILTSLAAIAGYQVGYLIGERAGPRFFNRSDGLLFKKEYVERANDFFNKHGGKAILLARFVAIVRTVIPLVSGIGKMDKRRFFIYNVAGAVLWVCSVILAAYWLGSKLPNIDKYLILMLIAAMLITTGSVFIEVIRTPARRKNLKKALKEEFRFIFRRNKT